MQLTYAVINMIFCSVILKHRFPFAVGVLKKLFHNYTISFMKRILFFITLFFVTNLYVVSNLYASSFNDQKLLSGDSFVYDALNALAYETGTVSNANQSSLSIGELKLYLNEIDYDSLSSAGKDWYDKIVEYMNKEMIGTESGFLSFGTSPSVNVEGFFKTCDDISFYHDYYKRNRFLNVPLFIGAGNFLTLDTEVYLGTNFHRNLENDCWCNIPLISEDDADANFPKVGYVSLGLENSENESFLNFQLGMIPRSIGRTESGSIIASENVFGTSSARLSVFSPSLKYTADVTQFDVNKYMYMHILNVKPFQRFSFGLVEGTMVNAPLEIRYLNPFSVFHSFAAWKDYSDYDDSLTTAGNYDDGDSRVSIYFGATFDVSLFKYLRLYGLFAMNQYQTKYEIQQAPDSAGKIPNSFAWQGGLESYIPVNGGYVNLLLEGVYLNPWMYVTKNKDWSFMAEDRELVYPGHNSLVRTWLGCPLGPDTVSCLFKAGYVKPGKYDFHFGYRFLVQGENANINMFDNPSYFPSSYDEAQISTPYGTACYENRIFLEGNYSFTPYFDANASLCFTHLKNAGHISGENRMGFEIALGTSFKVSDFIK